MWINQDELNKKILLDSDVLRHFLRGRSLDLLREIFPENLYILDLVEHEICRSPRIAVEIQRIIENGTLKRLNFPTGTRFINEYAELVRRYGVGESACMAVARYRDDIIASNNLNDIEEYCHIHDIQFLKTIDILYIAYKRDVMSEADVDEFLDKNLSGENPSKIPFSTLQQFISTNPKISDLFLLPE